MYWTTQRTGEKRRLAVPESAKEAARRVFAVADAKVRGLASKYPDGLPLFTTDGVWDFEKEAWTDWCQGFIGGQMWLLWEHFGAQDMRELAEHYSELVRDRQHDDETHDLGFLIAPTFKQKWELTGDADGREVAITAARTLASRYHENCRVLPSFVAPESTFIDIMRNIGLVMWAGLEAGDDDLVRKARDHSLTTRKYLVRGDGSAVHEGQFDVAAGTFERATTHQGWRPDSSWARGLAWSLAGFTEMYALYDQPEFLEVAQLNATYWLRHTSGDGVDVVPPNDFDEVNPPRPWESSAAAAAAQGLLHLARFVEDNDLAQEYHDHAVATFERLASSEFLASVDEPFEGVLKHGVYHERKDLGVDEAVMWGEFFFLEFARDLLAD